MSTEHLVSVRRCGTCQYLRRRDWYCVGYDVPHRIRYDLPDGRASRPSTSYAEKVHGSEDDK